MKKRIVIVIGVLTGLTALYVLLPYNYWQGLLQRLSTLLSGHNPLPEFPVWFIALVVLFDVVLVAKLIGATGLLLAKRWGWWAAIIALTADILVRVAGMINAWTSAYRQTVPPPEVTATDVVVTVTMMPTYLITLISLASVILLTHRTIKNIFIIHTAQQSVQGALHKVSGLLTRDVLQR